MEKSLQFTLLISLISLISATDYILSPVNDDIFKRCPGHEKDFLDKYFDLSGLKFTRISEDLVEASGTIKYIGNLPPDAIIQFEAKFYKKILGDWVENVSVVRENFCAVMFSETELWYPIAKYIKAEDRICPLNAGWQTEVKNVQLIFKIKGGLLKNAHGDYKVVATFKYKNELICLVVYCSLDID